ncbi:MAG TPA: bifunctional diaminohydroxyphosphoribosylaminopyrimidine deaminase/5-amino-6-(5-phosphoribosylamino)uracil reductase RibD, partial [Candidatus Cloacimonadota bacterium]|nr:bifunctional diaminohydroxyphosphoribosylaminopyrimidine deaminase/5-amino-6-(5-phosphoribosylamino)uracil reductase RibD [Candidatus Cloacimonadota bacterium]
MAYQEKYMKLAIETAEKGRFLSRPNPFVGAVIVKDDTVIGLGYTQKCGSDHAEIVALKQAGDQAKGASLYVTLEPCCHYGKTPPCTEAIIKAGIKHVYAGLSDPNPAVNGKGFGYLLQADIEVEFGFMAEQIEKQLEAFLTWKRLKRP